jgi:hypothetical protein
MLKNNLSNCDLKKNIKIQGIIFVVLNWKYESLVVLEYHKSVKK